MTRDYFTGAARAFLAWSTDWHDEVFDKETDRNLGGRYLVVWRNFYLDRDVHYADAFDDLEETARCVAEILDDGATVCDVVDLLDQRRLSWSVGVTLEPPKTSENVGNESSAEAGAQ